MKRVIILTILALTLLIGCNKNNNEKVEKLDDGKILLKLQRLDEVPYEENEDYESSMIIQSENINIKGINHQNIANGILSDYKEKYGKAIDYIKKKYSDFDINKWDIMVNIFSESERVGIVKFNYQIGNMIDTNKSIQLYVDNDIITKITFINMDFNADEEALIKMVNDFKNSHIQEKKVFKYNEEFQSEYTKYTYLYNTDELRYTYQLFFYENYGEIKVVNNDYGTELIINKNYH